MNILVTGGSGNLGRPLVKAARAAGHTVRVLSRQTSRSPDVQWAVGDLVSGAGVSNAIAGIEAIIHTASDPKKPERVDVQGTRNLLAAARDSGVKHLLYISIVGVDAIPMNYYRKKHDAEQLIESSGVPYSLLRATQFHSLVEGMIAGFARCPLLLPLPADFRFQSVVEFEVAQLLVDQLLLGPGGRLPDFGGPEVLTLGEMAQVWMQVRHRRKPIVPLPLPSALATAFRQGKNTASAGKRGTVSWEDWLHCPSGE